MRPVGGKWRPTLTKDGKTTVLADVGRFVDAGQQLDHGQQSGAVADLPGDGAGVEVDPVDLSAFDFVEG